MEQEEEALQNSGSQHPDNESPSCSKQADVLAHRAAVSREASPLMDPFFDWLSNNSTTLEFQSALKESCFSSCIAIELNWKAGMKWSYTHLQIKAQTKQTPTIQMVLGQKYD